MYITLVIELSITLVLSAFFSGMEIAFVSSNRMLVEIGQEEHSLSKRLISYFYRHANGFVSTMLVGNNIVLVVYGILFAQLMNSTLFTQLDEGARVPLNTILSTLIVLFTGEFLPKLFFKSSPNKLLMIFAPLAGIFYIVLWPISRIATLTSRALLAIFGLRYDKMHDEEGFTKVDLDHLVQTSLENIDKDARFGDEIKIFQNALDFSDIKVRDCMVPRTEINAVDYVTCSYFQLLQKFVESGNSKIIVYRGDIDHIEGYIHSSEMFRNPERWQDHIRTLPFVPETMTAQKLMRIFLQQKRSLCVVVDEFGGTAGIVALEDIVEEIFGDIQDEHDNENYVARRNDDGSFILSARLEIDKVNKLFDLDLPESDEYMTVGGLILNKYRSFPKLNEKITIGRYHFKVLRSTMTKIELVRLEVDTE